MNDKKSNLYVPTAPKRTGGANEEGWWVEDVVAWAVVAEGIVEGDVRVMAAWLTAGLVAGVHVIETVGEVIEGTAEVAPRLAGIWVEWVDG